MEAVQGSLLLELAPELRNAIFVEVLVEVGEIWISSSNVPPLLQTCRQIRADALQLYYASNVFRVDLRRDRFDDSIVPWLKSTGTSALPVLSTIWLDDIYHSLVADAEEALNNYAKQLLESGCAVDKARFYIECQLLVDEENDYDDENLAGEPFWTNEPEKDFARTRAQLATSGAEGDVQ
ncbi:hypothetical protein LTR97_010452 [Elasticomyces elasticus]|uniref:Uncharacterized protein n=1 Tax=Elasticomyces elasticus TaxID=574655 RepID=A0AAN7VYA6_9PEZI|nr:hypothetical protein LTR97_010452 [Elasticomyces elasticus]